MLGTIVVCIISGLCLLAGFVCLAVAVRSAYQAFKQRKLKYVPYLIYGLLFAGVLFVMAANLFENRNKEMSPEDRGLITEQGARSRMWKMP